MTPSERKEEVHAATVQLLEQQVEAGYLEHVGADADGEKLFKLTPKGRAFVEAMPFNAQGTVAERVAHWQKVYDDAYQRKVVARAAYYETIRVEHDAWVELDVARFELSLEREKKGS